MQLYYTYILRCARGTYYVGHTDDLENRLVQHLSGSLKGFSSQNLPIKLVYYETFPSRDAAFAAETKLKGWSRRKKEALIDGRWDDVSKLARKKFLDRSY